MQSGGSGSHDDKGIRRYDPDLRHLPLIRGGRTLLNVCCYEYLECVARVIPEDLGEGYECLTELRDLFVNLDWKYTEEYEKGFAAAYTEFMLRLQEGLVNGSIDIDDGRLDPVLVNIFLNSNRSLELAAAFAYGSLSQINQTDHERLKKAAIKLFKRDKSSFSEWKCPTIEEVGIVRGVWNSIGRFQPMTTHSMPTIRIYNWNFNNPNCPIEVREGTMGERAGEGEQKISLRASVQSAPRNNPIFVAFLKRILDKHLYINNLGLDDVTLGPERAMERELSLGLHRLAGPTLNIATLPANSCRYMSKSACLSNEPVILAKRARSIMLETVLTQSDPEIKPEQAIDFYIPDELKEQLFGKSDVGVGYDVVEEKAIMSDLVENAFDALGIADDHVISKAQEQAAYVLLTKFLLPEFMINTLKPATINWACKDGIDRAAISSAIYNLLKSCKEGMPLTKMEFFSALHSPALVVKGRGINEHSRILWNVLDMIVRAKDLKVPEWLPDWCERNTPYDLQRIQTYKKGKHPILSLSEIVSQKSKSGSLGSIFSSKRTHEDADLLEGVGKLINLMKTGNCNPFTESELEAIKLNREVYLICQPIFASRQFKIQSEDVQHSPRLGDAGGGVGK